MRGLPRRLWRGLGRLYRNLLDHDVFLLSGSIAYAAIISFFPFLIGLIALLSRWVEQAKAQHAIERALAPYLPPGVVSLVGGTLDAAIQARSAAGLVAIVGLFWAATAVASALRHTLNKVLAADKTRPFWRRKGVELAMVGLAGGMISLSLATSTIATLLEAIPPLASATRAFRESRAVALLAETGPWVLSGAAFTIVYRFLPNTRVHGRSLIAGALTAMVLFESTKLAFFWYVRTLAEYPLVYSHLAGVVIFMVWVYLAALISLIGAEVMAITDGRGLR